MLLSMTGYGRIARSFKDRQIVFELKSLNSKFSDVRLKLPNEYRDKDPELRKLISSTAFRGKLEATLEIFGQTNDENHHIDQNVFLKYYNTLDQLALKLDLPRTDIISAILRLPNVVVSEFVEEDQEEWMFIKQLVQDTIEAFTEFRQIEGASIQKDIGEHVSAIAQLLTEVEPFESLRKEKVIQRLRQNLEEFMSKENVDKNRFEQEVLFYLEKIDISEEKVRLQQHCDYFLEELSNANELKGRKLSFICQEMGREINTLGSKAYYSEIQKVVVNMKDYLEKIKEQVANIL